MTTIRFEGIDGAEDWSFDDGSEPASSGGALDDAEIEVRHDMFGFYVCTYEEGEFENEGHASVGFDGRPHFATEAEAVRYAIDGDEVSFPEAQS